MGISRVDQLDVAEYSILLNKVCEAFFDKMNFEGASMGLVGGW